MKNTNFLFLIILISLSFFFTTAFAGRYICVDENDKEVECVVNKTNNQKSIAVPKPSYRTKGKPAGKPYDSHKKYNASKDKK